MDNAENLDLALKKEQQLPGWFYASIEKMEQSWTNANSGSGGECFPKEKNLSDALEEISKYDCPTKEEYLQTVAYYLLEYLTEEDFKTSLQDLKVRIEFVRQLSFDKCETDPDYLPVNFNSCAIGKADVGLLLVSTDESNHFKFPILIGDVK